MRRDRPSLARAAEAALVPPSDRSGARLVGFDHTPEPGPHAGDLAVAEQKGQRQVVQRGVLGPEDQLAPPVLHRAAQLVALEGVVERPSSVSVPGARALVLAEDRPKGPPAAFIRGREFAHFHPGPDWSLHLVLADLIADPAIDRGWVELHLIARTEEFPGSVVMVYAPRDTAEAEVVWTLLQASHAFASTVPGI